VNQTPLSPSLLSSSALSLTTIPLTYVPHKPIEAPSKDEDIVPSLAYPSALTIPHGNDFKASSNNITTAPTQRRNRWGPANTATTEADAQQITSTFSGNVDRDEVLTLILERCHHYLQEIVTAHAKAF